MLIGIDLDDTLAGYIPMIKEIRDAYYGPGYANPNPVIPSTYGIQNDPNWFEHPYHHKVIHDLWEQDYIVATPLLEGEATYNGITQLLQMGHQVVFITARTARIKNSRRLKHVEDMTKQWAYQYWGDWIEATFTTHKTVIPLDLMVDDSPFYFAPDLKGTTAWGDGVIKTTNYNLHSVGTRVDSIADLPALVNSYQLA